METKKVVLFIFLLVIILALLLTVYSLRGYVSDKLGFISGSGGYVFWPRLNTNFISSDGLVDNDLKPQDEILLDVAEDDIPEGFERDDLSQYFERFRISASPARSGFNDPLQNPSRITLRIDLKEGERIPITGWKIRANNDFLTIPKAVQYYVSPSGGPEFDIVLKEGNHEINIYSSKSSLSKNFRENKCTGYLTNNVEFTPRINSRCARVDLNEFGKISGSCQRLLSSLNNGSCNSPVRDSSFAWPSGNYCRGLFDPTYCRNDFLECKQHFDEFTYASCYSREKNSADFLGPKWHIWVGINILSPIDDTVRLYDNKGKLVAEYNY